MISLDGRNCTGGQVSISSTSEEVLGEGKMEGSSFPKVSISSTSEEVLGLSSQTEIFGC